MAIFHGKWESLISITGDGYSHPGNGNFQLEESDGGGKQDLAISGSGGTYYWSSVGDDVDFADHIKARLEAASVTAGNSNTYTVSVDAGEDGTGKVTIAVDSGTYTLTWGNAEGQIVRDLCGFDDDITAQSTATSALQAKALWLPGCPVETPYHLDSSGQPQLLGAVTLSEDGTYNSMVGASHTRNEYVYQALTQAKTIAAAEDTGNESYEQFWLDSMAAGQNWAAPGTRMRWYKDADTDATYITYNQLNILTPGYERVNPSWDGLWRLQMNVALDNS